MVAESNTRHRRILHTSDLHLESLGDKACNSLETLVNLAIKANVDLVIIAGDFFEHNRVNDNIVSFAVKQLQRLSVPAVILPGNHDCLVSDSVYNRGKLWQGATNIRVFRAPQGETFAFPSLKISVWGKPLASYAGNTSPLKGIPLRQRKGQWHIAVAHGYYVNNTGAAVFSSFPITREEIKDEPNTCTRCNKTPEYSGLFERTAEKGMDSYSPYAPLHTQFV